MTSPGFVIVAVVAVAILFVLLPWAAHVFARYRAARVLPCPETGRSAQVGIDAARAAFTAAIGPPRLRARECSLWPARRGCAQGCLRLPEARTP